MNFDEGKRVFQTFDEANQAASKMRGRHSEGFRPYKVDGGWAVGGIHMRTKTPYKRVKSFEDIRALFANISESVDDAEIEVYESSISAELANGKTSSIGGGEDKWTLESYSIKTGRELDMRNDKQYLVLALRSASDSTQIMMGGAFSPSIPLVYKQAASLIGKAIVWHTWNSKSNPDQWSASKWFYMIEEA